MTQLPTLPHGYEERVTPLITNIWNARPGAYEPGLADRILGADWTATIQAAPNRRSIDQKMGNIIQVTMGNFPGFADLGTGHPSGCDISKVDGSAIVELKAKYNTTNSSSETTLKNELASWKLHHPNCECIWGVVVAKPPGIGGRNEFQHNGQTIVKWQGSEFTKWVFTLDGIDYTEAVYDMIRRIIQN